MSLTDPAKELADVLAKIAAEPNMAVSQRISMSANVNGWSPEFFRILFEITNRLDLVAEEVRHLPMDADVQQDALNSIDAIRNVFSDPGIMGQSTSSVRPVITGSNATVLKMLSSQIRERVSYPLLSEEEQAQVVVEVTTLRDWLNEVQSDQQDFIRQALIEGLDGLLFRLERLQWLGHGYVLNGLREVIGAYLSLQGATALSAEGNELQEAILAKTKGALVRIFGILDLAKENTERADWALRAYGAVSAISQGSSAIAGLLT